MVGKNSSVTRRTQKSPGFLWSWRPRQNDRFFGHYDQQFPVAAQELLPTRLTVPFRRRVDAVLFRILATVPRATMCVQNPILLA